MINNLLIITAVSCWGKTTLQNELLERWYRSPINFTTRKPRSEKEKDEYVFITKSVFMKKLANGDFLEHTVPNWEYYWTSRFLPSGDIVLVLDPVGRAQVMEKYAREGLKVTTIYLNISPELQLERLEERRMSVIDIKARQKDFDWLSPTKFCLEIDWELNVSEIADIVEDHIASNNKN